MSVIYIDQPNYMWGHLHGTTNKAESCQYCTIIKTESGLHRTDNEMKNSIVRAVLKYNEKIVETCKIDNIYAQTNAS
jgi:hypothetical protein